MAAYYNEIDGYCAGWLRNLIAAGHLPEGDVDERDIRDVRADDLRGYTQCHFFAGIGGWPYALRLAGIPDDRPVWTGSCPCPPFSAAGKKFRCPRCDTPSPVPNAVRTGAFNCIRCDHEWQADERHLWPELFRLIRECRPEQVYGEQVASKDGRTWLDIVCASLEMAGYAVGTTNLPASAVQAPHARQRLWFVGYADGGHSGAEGLQRGGEHGFGPEDRGTGFVADLKRAGLEIEREQSAWNQRAALERSGAAEFVADAYASRCRAGRAREAGDGRDAPRLQSPGLRVDGPWSDLVWLPCTDGKQRPTQSGLFPLADGLLFRLGSGSPFEGKSRTGMLRGAGNAIVPQVAAEFILATREAP